MLWLGFSDCCLLYEEVDIWEGKGPIAMIPFCLWEFDFTNTLSEEHGEGEGFTVYMSFSHCGYGGMRCTKKGHYAYKS